MKNVEADSERRDGPKGKAEYGDNMEDVMIKWCIGCEHLATAAAAGDLTCVRCLRGIVDDNLNEISQPENYKGVLSETPKTNDYTVCIGVVLSTSLDIEAVDMDEAAEIATSGVNQLLREAFDIERLSVSVIGVD